MVNDQCADVVHINVAVESRLVTSTIRLGALPMDISLKGKKPPRFVDS